jgi:bifunctional UDP-N-acetylglucosamine pyrophosphorylase / glucosamine-1-phosphate N-acetyltransferase
MTTAIVLAAGIGKRMKSAVPKVLHQAAGRSLVGHVCSALQSAGVDDAAVVVSSKFRDETERTLSAEGCGGLSFVVQDPPLGTGDAVRAAIDDGVATDGVVVVVPGDTPLLTAETIRGVIDRHETGAGATVVTTEMDDPTGYGRIIRDGDGDGDVAAIVEERDASEEQRKIAEINAGVFAFDGPELARQIRELDTSNDQGEYYLTDVIRRLRDAGKRVTSFSVDSDEVAGVNSRAQLAEAARLLRGRTCERLMDEGVTIVDPTNTYIDSSVVADRDATILPFTFLEGQTRIGEGAEVGPHARIVDSTVEAGATVTYAVVRESSIGPEASVGPFASLRPGTRLERGARLGSFVEAKNATLGENSKANHLAYLGDAEIGRGVNIGAGTITCNWDGKAKHKTVIEDEAYIGSDTMIVAPARIGKRAATGAGSVVRGEVPDEALAVGVPARILEGKGNKMAKEPDADA